MENTTSLKENPITSPSEKSLNLPSKMDKSPPDSTSPANKPNLSGSKPAVKSLVNSKEKTTGSPQKVLSPPKPGKNRAPKRSQGKGKATKQAPSKGLSTSPKVSTEDSSEVSLSTLIRNDVTQKEEQNSSNETKVSRSSLLERLHNLTTFTYNNPRALNQDNFYPLASSLRELCRQLKYNNFQPTIISFLKYYVQAKRIEIVENKSVVEQQLAAQYSLPYYPTTSMLSRHPHARIARHAVDKAILLKAIDFCKKDVENRSICDFYGSNRHKGVFDSFNKVLRSAFQNHTNPIRYTWYRPLITPKDYVTYPKHLEQLPSTSPNADSYVLVQDLYNQSPIELLNELDLSGARQGVIVLMIYSSTVLAGSMFDNEGPYYQKDGLFHCSPSEMETEWCPSPPNEFWLEHSHWLLESKRTAIWDLCRTYSEYHVFNFTILERELQNEIPRPIKMPNSALIIEKDVPPPVTWFDRLRVRFFTLTGHREKLQVFRPALLAFESSMVGKTRQAYQISHVTAAVEKSVSAIPHFFETVAFDRQRVIQDTVQFIVWDSFGRDLSLLEQASDLYGTALNTFKTLKAKMSSGNGSHDAKNFLFLAALAGVIAILALIVRILRSIPLFFAMRIIRGPSAAAASLLDILDNPMLKGWFNMLSVSFAGAIEERFKQQQTFGTLMISVIESAMPMMDPSVSPRLSNLPFVKALLAFLFKFGLHSIFSKLSPLWHSVWNVGAIAWESVESGVSTRSIAIHAIIQTLLSLLGHAVPWSNRVVNLYMSFGSISFLGALCTRFKNPEVFIDAQKRWFSSPIHSKISKLANKISIGSSPGTASVNTAHFDYVSRVTPSKVADFHEAMRSGTQKDFDLQEALLLTPEEAFVPSQINIPSPLPSDIYDLKIKPAGQFIIASSPAMFQRPVGVHHFYQALELRNLAPVPTLKRCEAQGEFEHLKRCSLSGFTGPPCAVFKQWNRLKRRIKPVLKQRVALCVQEESELFEVWKLRRTDWIAHFNTAMQRSRAREAVELRTEKEIQPKSSIFLKSDEVLAPKDLGAGVIGIKGRLVKAVHPTIQADACVQIDRAMKLLKMVFLEPFEFANGWLVHLSIGSGKNASGLSEWFTQSLDWVRLTPKRAAFIFAGDDTFFMFHSDQLLFGEVDFSKYDRTQGAHALSFEADILTILLCDPSMVGKLLEAIIAPAVYEDKSIDYRVKVDMPIQRATGGPDTTLGNSLNNALTTWSLFLNPDPDIHALPQHQASFGFESKFKISSQFLGMTFLKGSWFPSKTSFVWLPLPSQAIKLGKILTDPRLIYPNDAPRVAWRKAAFALAQGVGEIPSNYPILGDLLQLYRLNGVENDKKLKENFYRAEVDCHDVEIDEEFVSIFLFDRYGITNDEIEELRESLRQLRNEEFPFLFPSNSIWTKLWSDYE